MQFSANLGFLWTDRPLPDAIHAAGAAGFDAVECHWPYDVPATAIKAALVETGLPMLSMNTARGDVAAGDNGLAALPGREAEARAAIEQAVAYAEAIDARAIHVMAGRADGPAAREIFLENLHFAVNAAGGRMILIEPLNPFDAPGYFLNHTDQARDIIEEIATPNLRLMFDCYHVGQTEGDVIARLKDLLPLVGHIQFAGVPDRGRPDRGQVDYAEVFTAIKGLGWTRPLGAEYRPDGPTEQSLSWMETLTTDQAS
jgi:hydroxypyruvate isomerase